MKNIKSMDLANILGVESSTVRKWKQKKLVNHKKEGRTLVIVLDEKFDKFLSGTKHITKKGAINVFLSREEKNQKGNSKENTQLEKGKEKEIKQKVDEKAKGEAKPEIDLSLVAQQILFYGRSCMSQKTVYDKPDIFNGDGETLIDHQYCVLSAVRGERKKANLLYRHGLTIEFDILEIEQSLNLIHKVLGKENVSVCCHSGNKSLHFHLSFYNPSDNQDKIDEIAEKLKKLLPFCDFPVLTDKVRLVRTPAAIRNCPNKKGHGKKQLVVFVNKRFCPEEYNKILDSKISGLGFSGSCPKKLNHVLSKISSRKSPTGADMKEAVLEFWKNGYNNNILYYDIIQDFIPYIGVLFEHIKKEEKQEKIIRKTIVNDGSTNYQVWDLINWCNFYSQHGVKVTRESDEWCEGHTKGLHKNKSGNFHFRADTGTWKDHSTNDSGNAIKYLVVYGGIMNKKDAWLYLHELAGIEAPERDYKVSLVKRKRNDTGVIEESKVVPPEETVKTISVPVAVNPPVNITDIYQDEIVPEFDVNSDSLPVDVFPIYIRKYIEEASMSFASSPDFIAVSALSALSIAIGNSRRIIVKKGWSEGASLYCAIVANPGSGKSPAIKAALKPIIDIDQDKQKKFEEDLKEYRKQMRDFTLGKIQDEPEKPANGHLYTSNATIESLSKIASENQRGIMLYRDELSGWLTSFGQYKGGKGDDKQFYMECWSGSPIKTTRKSGDTMIVRNPFLTIIGSLQPATLHLLQQNVEDGFFDRFLISYPQTEIKEISEDVLSKETSSLYEEIIYNLYNFDGVIQDDGTIKPFFMEIEKGGFAVYKEWHDKLMKESSTFVDCMVNVFAKLRTQALRIALIFASIDGSQNVTINHLKRAFRLCDYFKSQYKKVFHYTGRTEDEIKSSPIMRYMIKKRLTEMTVRILVKNKIPSCRNAKMARENIQFLVDAGFVSWHEDGKRSRFKINKETEKTPLSGKCRSIVV